MKKSISKIILSSFILFSLHFSVDAQLTVDVLVVSGGGSGGAGYGGGGGGGAVKYFTSQTASGTTSVIVGAGGAAVNITTNGTAVQGNPGESSSFGSLIATSSSSANGPNSAGGGGGGAGSGGGAGGNYNTTSISGGTAVSGMGNNGGNSAGNGRNFSNVCGGGGGGAGAVGGLGGTNTSPANSGGAGGVGISNSISGVAVFYGGGGGGGVTFNGYAGGAGGNGGGGAGSKGDNAATNGTANTGGGGGGFGASNGGASNNYSGAGGSGVVIVRYPGSTILASGGTITQVGGYTIHTFNSSGTFSPCINPSSGGTIAAAQSGSNGFDPAAFTSSAAPTGHSGTLEYKWQSSTTSSSTGFSDIASSNSATYDAGALTQKTWFKRLARVDCSSDWTGAAESNVLEICITPTAGITNNTGSTALTCNRTSINVTATGGISYAWSGGLGSSDAATISSAGTYTVTVTGANSCTSTAAITIVSIPLPDATISANGVTTFTYGNSIVLSGPQVVPVSEGNALSLNGTSNYVSIPSGINSNFSANQITVEGWFYPTQSFPATVLIGEAFEGDGVIKFALYSNYVGGAQKIIAGFYSSATNWVQPQSSADLPFNQWTHIAATYDQTNIKIYVNGVLTCTQANTNALPNGSERWILGKCWDCSNYFPGKMDEVRIWNVARTQSQIQNSMNSTISPTTSGLLGYYKMDEASGNSAADATGHGYTGTVN